MLAGSQLLAILRHFRTRLDTINQTISPKQASLRLFQSLKTRIETRQSNTDKIGAETTFTFRKMTSSSANSVSGSKFGSWNRCKRESKAEQITLEHAFSGMIQKARYCTWRLMKPGALNMSRFRCSIPPDSF